MTLAVPLIRPQPFYLGTHQPHWVKDPQFQDVPLFISVRRLMRMKTLPRALGHVAFDSGGFSTIRMEGRWPFTADEYIDMVRRFSREVGEPDFIAPMDWMCEPPVIQGANRHLKPKDPRYFHGTRAARGIPEDGPDEDMDSAVFKHELWTAENVAYIRQEAPELKVIPVLQGYTLPQYERHRIMYLKDFGIDLRREPLVGLGSVCRRQGTVEVGEIVQHFTSMGIRIHGFGVKTNGLARYGSTLVDPNYVKGVISSDSMAWSFVARKKKIQLPGHEEMHINCANCKEYALKWRADLIDQLAPLQRAA